MLELDLIQTLAFAGVVLFVGYGIRRVVRPLARVNIPAPVIGGLLAAVVITIARGQGVELVQFDNTLQSPLMIAFFTTIGFGASVPLLKSGGPQVLLFFVIASIFAVAQNLLGAGVASAMGMHPLFGVLAGSVTLTGGPATGLAFAPQFEAAGIPAAASVAVAAAMVGIISGGLIGGPIGTWLVEKHRLRRAGERGAPMETRTAENIVEDRMGEEPAVDVPEGEDRESYILLKSVVVILVAMWLGSYLGEWITSLGGVNAQGRPRFALPAYIGAMLVAAVIRNLDDATKVVKLSQRTIDDVGGVALALFITMALMTLKVWELAGLALPLLVILVAQVILIALVCLFLIYWLMGRDYDAAVMSSGFCGFMLGTTANAMANMEALAEKYGPAPRAFLVVPMVGAFFIDFTNAVLILFFLNFLT